MIAGANKPFWGYSDLTTVINAIYTKAEKSSVLYQIKNLVYANGELQRKRFAEFVSKKNNALFDVNYSFLQGERMEGSQLVTNCHQLKMSTLQGFLRIAAKVK